MAHSENVRIIDFAKAKEYKRYEKVYILFLWISSIGIIAISLVVTAGGKQFTKEKHSTKYLTVIYMLTKENYILIVGECKAFVYGSAYLLCAAVLALLTAILTCAITTTKGKFVLTIFLGHIFSIGLVASGLMLAAKMAKMTEINEDNNTIIEHFRTTLNDSLYKANWIRIHKDFHCCGIDSLERNLHLIENNTSAVYKSISSTISKNSAPSNQNDLLLKILLVAEKLGVKTDFCINILDVAHRGCGILLLSRLERKTNLLKFYGTLILPMIFIADMLFFLGYLCFRDIKISLVIDARNKIFTNTRCREIFICHDPH